MKRIAAASTAGIDPLTWLRAKSDVEVAYLNLVAEQAIEIQAMQRADLAYRIIGALAQLLGAKKGKTSG